jgi:AcrR family transcriptional regulator
MSGNPTSDPPRLDARVRRSRDRLGDALVELVQEKPFDSITVQDVLDRAGVSRSTFYAHYRDKDDLFLSDADEFFEHMAMRLVREAEPSERVAPVREMLAHVGGEAEAFQAALLASGKWHDMLELAQAHFARGIEHRLEQLPRSRSLPAESRRALATAYSGAFLALLTGWLRKSERESPEQVDTLFHRLVWSGVDAAAGR